MKRMSRFVFLWVIVAVVMGFFGCNKTDTDADTQPPIVIDSVPVEYQTKAATLYSVNKENCLNSSASFSWAQRAPNKTVGIVYRESVENSTDSRLTLKTLLPDGSSRTEEVARHAGVENCVLLYDSLGAPHIFVVEQNGAAQDLVHLFHGKNDTWQSEPVSHFANAGGEYVMELTAAIGPNDSLHLAVLQFGATPENWLNANLNSHLFYITKKEGIWRQDLVEHFDSVYILMNTGYWYMRPLRRQSLAMDAAGNAHLAYGAIVYKGYDPYPSEMRYATNASGKWVIHTALPAPDNQSEAGYNPAIAIDSQGKIAMACTFMGRVLAKSANHSQLIYAELDGTKWNQIVLAEYADGYFGLDMGRYTGGIPHLCFDRQDHPHIIFCDISSSHVGTGSYLKVGQIRYLRNNGQRWQISTLYRQPQPRDYSHANEIHGQCLMLLPDTDQFKIVAEEFIADGADCRFNLLFLTVDK